MHNHPSGDPAPSPQDVELTRGVVLAGQLLEISVLDHLIVGSGGHVSLKEHGLDFPAIRWSRATPAGGPLLARRVPVAGGKEGIAPMLTLILVVLLVLILLGYFGGRGRYSGPYFGGGLGLLATIVVIILVLALLGVINV